MTGPARTPTPLACDICGTPTVPGARFCHHCGAPLERTPEWDTSAERRVVTVLFGDLSDFTAWAEDLDPERVGLVTDRVLAALSHAVNEVDGRVDKLTGDGIMAVFGAPTAHEDDAERAVRAAARMQRDVRRLMQEETGGGRRMGLRVGLNTGEVLAGVQAHLTYTVVGDTVNTASRLSDAAGIGSVYAGRDTALATMQIASWRALPPLRLKGKREPVPAYELVGLRPPGSVRLGLGEEAPFIGRDAEFGRLAGRLLDVIDGGVPATALVTGEAGIGKTRLVAELARFAGELPDVRVLWGRCTPYGQGRELAPLAQWVRTACGIDEAEDAGAAAERVRRTVARLEHPTFPTPVPPSTVDRLLSLLGLVESSPPGPRETATPGSALEHRDPLVDAVRAIVDGLAAEGPLVLVIDDMQWAGRELASAVARVMRGISAPVFLACLGRTEAIGDDWEEWWRRLPDPELIPLAPLEDPSAERLLRAYLGGADLDPAVRDALLDRARGNPFFLAELLHLLVDRGLLRRVGAAWRLEGELPADVLPAGVQAVLAARIDDLDAVSKAVLRDAAVAGTRFPLGAVVALGALPEDRLRQALEVLISRGLVVPQVSDGEPMFAFAHSLARDVAYAGVPKGDRARRHARVAVWAAGHLPGSTAEVDEFVSAQAEQAVALAAEMQLPPDDAAWEARGVGFAALARLGEAAAARDDNVRANGLLTRALELGGDIVPPSLRLPALVARASARSALHDTAGAELDLADPLGATEGGLRGSALVVLGELRRRRGDEPGAIAALVSALAAAADAGVDRVTGEALRQLGLVDYLAGRLSAAEARFRQALDLAERVEDPRGAGWALQHLAWSATTRGDYATAEEVLGRASEVFAALDDTGGLSWCAGTEAFVRLLQGRLRSARDLSRGLLPLGEAMGDRWGVAACLTIDAFASAELGDLTVAVDEAERAVRMFVDVGDTWGQAMALVALGVGRRAQGRLEDAVSTLHRAVEVSESGHHPVTGSLALAAVGYCHLDAGDLAAAEVSAERSLAMLTGMELEPHALVGPRVLRAQVLRARGRVDLALALLEELAEAPYDPSLLFPRRQALAHLAGARLEIGEPDRALRTAQHAMAVPAEDVRSRIISLRVLAACLAACDDAPAARFALRQALALAGSTEQVAERAATRRALDQLEALAT